jgi:tetratricopeptide (TPR) repeat protein
MVDRRSLPPGVSPLPVEPIVPVQAQPQQVSVQQALAIAERHQREGRLPEAERLLRQIVAAQPRLAPALHLLAVVLHQNGRTEAAVGLIGRAIEADPNSALYFANRGEMQRLLGDLDAAIADGERAIVLDPNAVGAISNVGIAYYDRKDYARAEEYQQRALRLQPNFAAALNNLGSVRRALKDRAGAIAMFERVLAVQPGYVEAINNLGAVLTESERFDEALPLLEKAVRMLPSYADAHCNTGLALCGLERFDAALAAYRRALGLRAGYVEAQMGVARALQGLDKLADAEREARNAIVLAPEKAEAHALLGGILFESGDAERSAAAYDAALRLDPDLMRAHLGRGSVLVEWGRFDEAEAEFLRALELEPDNVAARVSLVQVKKVAKDDANFGALAAEAVNVATMPRQKAIALHFALGKCYDDSGDYDRAFEHFEAGCKLKRSTIHYDADAVDRLIDRVIEFFDVDTLRRLGTDGDPSDVPVFVLGMARSGTTLTEQIIASHPRVHGAGELPDLLDLANRPNDVDDGRGFPDDMIGLSAADFGRLGRRYVDGLRQRSPDAARITDKMPANFLCIGLIRLMLPNAKIVHVKRNPVDTCLSGYSRLFNRGQLQSYDLTELGRYYRAYARLMDHWYSVLPSGAMLNVQYEDLVADNEAQARRLIAYCGLEWDDACLEFFANERSIRTASVVQVRQPIYKTSLDRWKRYERHLAPLLEVLGELVPRA